MIEGLAIAAALRPHARETICGDAWSFRRDGSEYRIALADGAGHGPPAAEAAGLAISVFEANGPRSPEIVLAECHAALKDTRGAVMTIAVIDEAAATLTVAGVGNVEALLLGADRERHVMIQRGLLGANIPRIRPEVFELSGDWVFALHSDGLRSRFTLKDHLGPQITAAGAQAAAERLLAQYARADDDASLVLVARSNTRA